MAITRTPMVDDDGTGTTGTIINNAWKQEFYNQIDQVIATGAATSKTDYAIAGGSFNIPSTPTGQIRIVNIYSTAGAVTITGADPTVPNDILIIQNVGNVPLHLVDGNATGKFYNCAHSAPTSIMLMGSAVYACQPDGRWFIVSHEQGAWITAPFNAANFFGASGMTWTVTAGQRQTSKYRLSGRTLDYVLSVNPSTIGGTLGPSLQVSNGEWGTFQIAGPTQLVPCIYSETGPYQSGFVLMGQGPTLLTIQKLSGTWAATSQGAVWITMTTEVT
jgi:hypothetical protein